MRRRTTKRIICVAMAGLIACMSAIAAPRSKQAVGVAELTPEADKAIKKGLAWLIKTQRNDGSWGSYKVASTALALMAFMVKGYFPERPPYGDELTKAVDYLVQESQRSRTGYMGRSMYEHGLGTLALSEVWGMTSRKDVRDALKLAVDVILKSQNGQGGWRYNPRPADADLSVTVMQIVALASAKEAGILVPDKVMEKALKYVMYCQHKQTGGFGYTGPGGPGFARSAAGVMSLMMCGKRDAKETKNGLAYLEKLPGKHLPVGRSVLLRSLLRGPGHVPGR